MMPKIIGVAGPKGSGKTTVANILANKLNGVIVPFAKPLKDIARSLGWNGKKDEKGRRLLQLLGTECGRECIDQDIWVKKWLAYVDIHVLSSVVIADDVRFENEASMILKNNGTLIEVKREGYEYSDEHASEKGLDKNFFDMIVVNNKSMESLKGSIESWANTWLT
jgi:hypothetical protein